MKKQETQEKEAHGRKVKRTIQEQIAEMLQQAGMVEVLPAPAKYRKFSYEEQSFFFVGKAGAIRVGASITDSISLGAGKIALEKIGQIFKTSLTETATTFNNTENDQEPEIQTKTEDQMKKQTLINAVKELNQIVGVEPAIDLSAKAEDLEKAIKSCANLIETTDLGAGDDPEAEAGIDYFSPEVVETLRELECLPGMEATKPEPNEADGTPAIEEAPETDLAKLINETKKLADLKEIAKTYPAFESIDPEIFVGLSGPLNIKVAMFEALGVDPASLPKPSAAAKVEKPAKEKKATEPKVKKEGKERGDPSKSNKGIVYMAWKNGEADAAKLLEMVNSQVQEKTIKAWIQAWKKGNNLPAIAK